MPWQVGRRRGWRTLYGQRHQLAAVLVAIGTFAAGCREDGAPLLAKFDAPTGPPKSLRETFDFLRDAHARKSYLAMRPYIEPGERGNVIDLLMAVDELLAANAGALRAVARVSPEMPASRLDAAPYILDTLGMFSREVEIIEQHEDPQAGTGEILLLIAGEPPPLSIEFKLLDGRWVYAPGAGGGEIIAALRNRTKALARIEQALAVADRLTPAQVAEEYELRLRRRIRPAVEPVATQPVQPS